MTLYANAIYLGNRDLEMVDANFYPIKEQAYPVMIEQRLFGRIRVTRVHGYENKPYPESTIPYASLREFLQDWTGVVEVSEHEAN